MRVLCKLIVVVVLLLLFFLFFFMRTAETYFQVDLDIRCAYMRTYQTVTYSRMMIFHLIQRKPIVTLMNF